jgi:hypothetical protein
MKRLIAAMALLAVFALPASASAAPHHPTGEFAHFGDCPLSNATIDFCLYSETLGGSVTTGKKTVPIVKPVILQGGFDLNQETGTSTFVGAEDGSTLSKTPQPVPGGLTGIVAPSWWPSILRDLFNETINNGFTGVTSTLELAGPVQFNLLALLGSQGAAITMPAKIKLSNPFLGNNCYIGSSSNPVVLALTTGTTAPPPPNTPITGSKGTIASNETGTYLKSTGGRLVNNSFATPGANGCGGLFSFLVDPFVNSIVGVPSPAGTNTAVLEGNIEFGQREAVIASE